MKLYKYIQTENTIATCAYYEILYDCQESEHQKEQEYLRKNTENCIVVFWVSVVHSLYYAVLCSWIFVLQNFILLPRGKCRQVHN